MTLSSRHYSPGFTLVELIVVMVILAIVAGVVAPSLSRFRLGRSNANAANQLVALASYARTQSASEGRTYRLNFDPDHGEYWLTAQGPSGTYDPPDGDYGQHFTVPDGVLMQIKINPQANSQMTVPSTVNQVSVQQAAPVADPLVTQPNTLMQNVRNQQDGQYVEFQPGGRTDSVLIELTDRTGSAIQVGCASATEMLHVLSPGEMQ
jgi:prepilin-type N-terminal cleavage/methylation domain-containing protein